MDEPALEVVSAAHRLRRPSMTKRQADRLLRRLARLGFAAEIKLVASAAG